MDDVSMQIDVNKALWDEVQRLREERDTLAAALERVINACRIEDSSIDGVPVDDIHAVLAARDAAQRRAGAIAALQLAAVRICKGMIAEPLSCTIRRECSCDLRVNELIDEVKSGGVTV